SNIELGTAIVGGSSVSQVITLTNSGSAPVTISSVTVTSPFTLANNCTQPLAPSASCTLVVSFSAPSVGDFSGSLAVVSDAEGGSGEIGVHAVGQVVAAPLLRVAPTAIGFGDRVIGSQTSTQSVTITNIGGVMATLSVAVNSIDFLLSGN